jgi:hypothetical protein
MEVISGREVCVVKISRWRLNPSKTFDPGPSNELDRGALRRRKGNGEEDVWKSNNSNPPARPPAASLNPASHPIPFDLLPRER